MANALNTDWKLTNLSNEELWNSGSDKLPDNLSEMVNLEYEHIPYPKNDQDGWLAWGPNGRPITLQGIAEYDSEAQRATLWKLSSSINNQELMKFWAGEDWFCYVLGSNCQITRDDMFPSLRSYNGQLNGVDPFWYNANSDAGSGSGYDWVVPQCIINKNNAGTEAGWDAATSYLTFLLAAGVAPYNTTYIEPIFWCIGGASSSVSQLQITDFEGRRLVADFPSNVSNGKIYIIAPYKVDSYEGFAIKDASIVTSDADVGATFYTPPSGTVTVSPGTWALDIINNQFYNRFFNSVEPKGTKTNQSSDDWQRMVNQYPRARVGVSNERMTLVTTGTNTDFKVYGQYCYKRL